MKSITSHLESAEMYRDLAEQAESIDERRLFLKIADTWNWMERDNNSFELNVSRDRK